MQMSARKKNIKMKKIITDIKKKFKKQHKYYILYISDEVISNASFSNEILKLNESFSIKLFIPKEYFYLRSDFHLNEFKSFFNFCDLTFCESRNHLSIFNFILYNINNEFELYCSESI